MANKYGALLEGWKLDLLEVRARRKGLRDCDLEDAEQEIVPAILNFTYDPANANGATETTALTAVIDKNLTAFQRASVRQRMRDHKYAELSGLVEGSQPREPMYPDHEPRLSRTMDVRAAVAGLTPLEQSVCAALSRGDSCLKIARDLRVTRYRLECIIEGIRDHFQDMGLGAWVGVI